MPLPSREPSPPPPPPPPVREETPEEVAIRRLAAAQDGTLDSLLDALNHAKKTGAPAHALAPAEEAARTLATANLTETLDAAQRAQGAELLDKLAIAKRAGVPATELTAEEERARKAALTALEQAAAKPMDHAGVAGVVRALDHAANAQVPAEKVSAVRRELQNQTWSRLKAAIMAVNRTQNEKSVQEIAEAVNAGRAFGVADGEDLAFVRELFEANLETAFVEKDWDKATLWMEYASSVSAAMRPEMARWKSVIQRIQRLVADQDPEHIQMMTSHVREAEEVGLPIDKVKVFHDLVAYIKAHSDAKVDEVLEMNENGTDVLIGDMLRMLRDAEKFEVSPSKLTSAQAKVQKEAARRLQTVSQGEKSHNTLPVIREAFRLAKEAGVLENERTSTWTALQKEAESRLKAAMQAFGANFTKETLQELLDAKHVGSHFGISQESIGNASKAYEEKFEAALKAKNWRQATIALSFWGLAGPDYERPLRRWALQVRHLQYLSNPAEATEWWKLPEILKGIRDAEEMELPEVDELVAARSTATNLTTAMIDELVAMDEIEMDVDTRTRLLDQARTVNVSADRVSNWERRIRADAANSLDKALLSDKTPSGVRDINAAFAFAEKVGVPAWNISDKRAKLRNDTQVRLAAALSVAKANETTIKSEDRRSALKNKYEELASAIYSAEAFGLDQETVTNAKGLCAEHVEVGIVEKDLDQVEFSMRCAAKRPREAEEWVQAANRLRRVTENLEEQLDPLPNLLEHIQYAHNVGLPQIKELLLLQDHAKIRAATDLKATSASEQAKAIRTSIDVAQRAGVPETELAAARQALARAEL